MFLMNDRDRVHHFLLKTDGAKCLILRSMQYNYDNIESSQVLMAVWQSCQRSVNAILLLLSTKTFEELPMIWRSNENDLFITQSPHFRIVCLLFFFGPYSVTFRYRNRNSAHFVFEPSNV